MERKERITGLRFSVPPTEENIAICSALSANLLKALVERHHVAYNQLLYPYADALSLSGAPGTQSTRIFGTHLLLRNIPNELLNAVMQQCFTDENAPNTPPEQEIVEFSLTEGAAKSSDVVGFLREGETCPLPSAGDFGGMLGGYLPHWRIRECARYFASFSEMSYRRAKGEIVGLYGGRLILTRQCDCPEAIAAIFAQKTGA